MSPTASLSPAATHEGALARREAELLALLRSLALAAPVVDDSSVSDFKDLAATDAQVQIDEARISSASRELAQVLTARARLNDGLYGICEDCGATIEEARLAAMPEALYCTCCQTTHEGNAVAAGAVVQPIVDAEAVLETTSMMDTLSKSFGTSVQRR